MTSRSNDYCGILPLMGSNQERMNKLLMFLLLLVIAGGCNSTVQRDNQQRPVAKAPAPRAAIQLRFPLVDGWQQAPIKIAEADDGTAYAMSYRSPQGMMVTIMLYRYEIDRTTALDFRMLQQEMREMRQNLSTVKQPGIYQTTELAVETIELSPTPPSLRALRGIFLLDTIYGYAISDIYLTIYRQYLVKIQCNRPLNLDDSEIKAIEKLLSHLGQSLSRS